MSLKTLNKIQQLRNFVSFYLRFSSVGIFHVDLFTLELISRCPQSHREFREIDCGSAVGPPTDQKPRNSGGGGAKPEEMALPSRSRISARQVQTYFIGLGGSEVRKGRKALRLRGGPSGVEKYARPLSRLIYFRFRF